MFLCCDAIDEIEVTNAIYGKDTSKKDVVLGCGVPGDDSSALKFTWLKKGTEIHSSDHLVVAEHRDFNYSFSTVTIKKIGKMLHNVTRFSYVIVTDNIYVNPTTAVHLTAIIYSGQVDEPIPEKNISDQMRVDKQVEAIASMSISQ